MAAASYQSRTYADFAAAPIPAAGTSKADFAASVKAKIEALATSVTTSGSGGVRYQTVLNPNGTDDATVLTRAVRQAAYDLFSRVGAQYPASGHALRWITLPTWDADGVTLYCVLAWS